MHLTAKVHRALPFTWSFKSLLHKNDINPSSIIINHTSFSPGPQVQNHSRQILYSLTHTHTLLTYPHTKTHQKHTHQYQFIIAATLRYHGFLLLFLIPPASLTVDPYVRYLYATYMHMLPFPFHLLPWPFFFYSLYPPSCNSNSNL